MPFKFIDDHYPEADDYSSNYVWVPPQAVSGCVTEGLRRDAPGCERQDCPYRHEEARTLRGRFRARRCACGRVF